MTLILKNFSIRKKTAERLFEPLTLEVKAGNVLCLMGPSGCGKSTLLDAIAGHLQQEFSSQGEMHLFGQNLHALSAEERKVGILFQDDLLFPHLRVWENLAFAVPDKIPKEGRKRIAYDALNNVNLQPLARVFPDQLSGGQKARISLIRMLLAKPKLALLDEPFSKLDQISRCQFRAWVFEQIRIANIPALLVTHDLEDLPVTGQLLTWPWGQKTRMVPEHAG